jgi:hypothetical protein
LTFSKKNKKRLIWLANISVMIGITIVVFGLFEAGKLIGDVLAVFAVTCRCTQRTL